MAKNYDKYMLLYYPDEKVKFHLKVRATLAKLSVSKYLLFCSSFYESYKKANSNNETNG